MKLLDEIIRDATTDGVPVSSMLRKCLVLSYQLKNMRLQDWVEAELNGYQASGEVPPYRKIRAIAKGLFLGGFGSEIRNQPLSPHVLKKEHRHFAESLDLFQPIASYDRSVVGDMASGNAIVEWPPFLTTLYQSKFIEGYALNRAWQEIPNSALVGLVETVRNRVLKFALELRDELGAVGDELESLPPATVDRNVTTIILGGGNIIGGQNNTTNSQNTVIVSKGDQSALEHALEKLGIPKDDFAALHSAMKEDNSGKAKKTSLGARTLDWIKAASTKVGSAGIQMTADIAKSLITQWLTQYLGLPTP